MPRTTSGVIASSNGTLDASFNGIGRLQVYYGDNNPVEILVAVGQSMSQLANNIQGLANANRGGLSAISVEATKDGRFSFSGNNAGLNFGGNDSIAEKLKLNSSSLQLEPFEELLFNIHIGASAGESLQLSIDDMRARALGINGINVSTQEGAETALAILDNATEIVSSTRSKMGAIQNRLEYSIANLSSAGENLTTAESRIRSTDIAAQTLAYTKDKIMAQASQVILIKASQRPGSVLQLLRQYT